MGLKIIPIDSLADRGTWREELDDEDGPRPGSETEAAFLSRMHSAYERRRQQARLVSPGAVVDRDAAWFVRYQLNGEDLSAMPDVEGCRRNRRAINAGPLPRALDSW